MALSAEDRQKAVDVMSQLLAMNGMDSGDAATLAEEVIDEAAKQV
jgi:uncharacterized protein YoaH (UPF0181 family)